MIHFCLCGLLPLNAINNLFIFIITCQMAALKCAFAAKEQLNCHRISVENLPFAPSVLLHRIKNAIPENTLLHKCLIFFKFPL